MFKDPFCSCECKKKKDQQDTHKEMLIKIASSRETQVFMIVWIFLFIISFLMIRVSVK